MKKHKRNDIKKAKKEKIILMVLAVAAIALLFVALQLILQSDFSFAGKHNFSTSKPSNNYGSNEDDLCSTNSSCARSLENTGSDNITIAASASSISVNKTEAAIVEPAKFNVTSTKTISVMNLSTNKSITDKAKAQAITKKPSQVEFYLIVKDKAYLMHILAEGESAIYNISGKIVSVEPLIITGDVVKFRINNYATKNLKEGESDQYGAYEIIVSEIYRRR